MLRGNRLTVNQLQHPHKGGISEHRLPHIDHCKPRLFAGQKPIERITQHTAFCAGQQEWQKFPIGRCQPAQPESGSHREPKPQIDGHKQQQDSDAVSRCKKSVEQDNWQGNLTDDRFQAGKPAQIEDLFIPAPAANQQQYQDRQHHFQYLQQQI